MAVWPPSDACHYLRAGSRGVHAQDLLRQVLEGSGIFGEAGQALGDLLRDFLRAVLLLHLCQVLHVDQICPKGEDPLLLPQAIDLLQQDGHLVELLGPDPRGVVLDRPAHV
eukprot:4280699-Lingulodinium_polyedra.AAC.1